MRNRNAEILALAIVDLVGIALVCDLFFTVVLSDSFASFPTISKLLIVIAPIISLPALLVSFATNDVSLLFVAVIVTTTMMFVNGYEKNKIATMEEVAITEEYDSAGESSDIDTMTTSYTLPFVSRHDILSALSDLEDQIATLTERVSTLEEIEEDFK